MIGPRFTELHMTLQLILDYRLGNAAGLRQHFGIFLVGLSNLVVAIIQKQAAQGQKLQVFRLTRGRGAGCG